MKRLVTAFVLLVALLAGCAGKGPAPVAVPEPGPVPAPPATPAEPPPLPRLLPDHIHAVQAWNPESRDPGVWLEPDAHPALVKQLLVAIGQVTEARPRMESPPARLQANIHVRSGSMVILTLPRGEGPVEVDWDGRALLIDSPQVADALAALESEVAKAPKVGTRVWAIDPAGKREPELLLDHSTALHMADMSPDGRYALLIEQLGQYKGDYTAIPHLWDRSAGTTIAGAKTTIRHGIWSGRGFYLDWLTHYDLELKEARLSQLELALGLKKDERGLIAASFTADGRRFAALVGHPWMGEPIDLVQGNSDGTGLTTQAKVVAGHATQMGTYARLYLSPDGQWLVLEGRDGTVLLPAANPATDRLIKLQGGRTVWAPDSRHLWVQGGGVYDLKGQLVVDTGQDVYHLVWQLDGRGGLFQGPGGVYRSFDLRGTVVDVKLPERGLVQGFLPDGRLLVWSTVYPRF